MGSYLFSVYLKSPIIFLKLFFQKTIKSTKNISDYVIS